MEYRWQITIEDRDKKMLACFSTFIEGNSLEGSKETFSKLFLKSFPEWNEILSWVDIYLSKAPEGTGLSLTVTVV